MASTEHRGDLQAALNPSTKRSNTELRAELSYVPDLPSLLIFASIIHLQDVKRRNGKLQSCEPCRKRKVSCDHRLPACTRCASKGNTNDCYYHPAPMSQYKARGMPSSASPPEVPTPQSSNRPDYAQVLTPVTFPTPMTDPTNGVPYRSETVPPPNRLPEILSVPSAGILMDSVSLERSVGFLGETSFSAVVAELNSSMGIQTHDIISEPRKQRLSEDYLRKGIELLRFFEDIEKVGLLLNRWMKYGDGYLMFMPVYRLWFEGLVPIIRRASRTNNLEGLATSLWSNTQRSLASRGDMSIQEWAQQATGDNLRWEPLGLFLTVFGAVAAFLPGWDPIFKATYERRQLMDLTTRLVDVCVDLTKRCGSRNELLLCLAYERVLLLTGVYGDAHSDVWHNFSEVADTTILLGLHLELRQDPQTPFFLHELRLRIFNVVYSMDKWMAIFLGRPPRISYRYCVVQEPHDLSDEELCSPPAVLEQRLAELEASGGWSVSGHPARSCWRKAWSKLHELREDILEIVIGPRITNIEARLEYIRARQNELISTMPEFCRVDPEELINNIKRDPTFEMVGRGVPWRPLDVHCALAVHRGIIHADFLLERALVHRTGADSSRLVVAARRLLSLILKATQLRDYLYEYQSDFTDMLSFYAVPPAGVLAIEMLKRDQSNISDDTFPRSDVLQQLSVLVPALESVQAGEGNYKICVMGLKAIRKVLDILLAKPAGRPLNMDANQGMINSGQFEIAIGNDADFLAWLGQVDFDTNAWLEPL